VTKKTPCHNDTMRLSTAQRKGHAMACALIARRAQEALKHHIRMGRSSYSRSVPTLPTKRTLYRMRCFSKDGICCGRLLRKRESWTCQRFCISAEGLCREF